MKLNKTVLALALCAIFLSACSSTDEKDASLTDGSQMGGINDASTSGLNGRFRLRNRGSGMGGVMAIMPVL